MVFLIGLGLTTVMSEDVCKPNLVLKIFSLEKDPKIFAMSTKFG